MKHSPDTMRALRADLADAESALAEAKHAHRSWYDSQRAGTHVVPDLAGYGAAVVAAQKHLDEIARELAEVQRVAAKVAELAGVDQRLSDARAAHETAIAELARVTGEQAAAGQAIRRLEAQIAAAEKAVDQATASAVEQAATGEPDVAKLARAETTLRVLRLALPAATKREAELLKAVAAGRRQVWDAGRVEGLAEDAVARRDVIAALTPVRELLARVAVNGRFSIDLEDLS